jgi:type VI secretion system secreted protein Hcp
MADARNVRVRTMPRDEDLYLRLELARTGMVRGESLDHSHRDEMELASWDWGIRAGAEVSGLGPASRAALGELRIRKAIDRASPVLMAAVRRNEPVRRAVLSMRKAGGAPQDYLRVILHDGRVTDYRVGTSGAVSMEDVSFSFRGISIEYRAQGGDGQLGGVVSFVDEAS